MINCNAFIYRSLGTVLKRYLKKCKIHLGRRAMIWPCDIAIALKNVRFLKNKIQPTDMGRAAEHPSLHQGLGAVMVDRKGVVICFSGVATNKCPSSNK